MKNQEITRAMGMQIRGLNIPVGKIIQIDVRKRTSSKTGGYNRSEKVHPKLSVNDWVGKYTSRDETKQKMIVQAIKLFKKVFTEDK